MKKNRLYVYSTVSFMLVLPILSILAEKVFIQRNEDLVGLIGKWFVFWAIGLRLFIAGVRQIFQPKFTVENIFNFESKESEIIVRELGFANVCFGLLGILSVVFYQFRISAALVGGIYLGFAGIYHLIKGPQNTNEKIAMYSDLFIFAAMTIFVIFVLYS